MTVAQLLQQAIATLQPVSATAHLDAQLLLAHLLDKPRSCSMPMIRIRFRRPYSTRFSI